MKLRLAIVLVLTGVFLALALRGLELDAALATLRAVDWRAVAPMMGAYVMVHSLRSLRLGLLLAAPACASTACS